MKYAFQIVDVFSSTPFGGNQLAVLPAVADWQAGGVLLIRATVVRKGHQAEATLAPRKAPRQHDKSHYIGRTCLPSRLDSLDDLQGPQAPRLLRFVGIPHVRVVEGHGATARAKGSSEHH
jgi:hypothetical protein